MRRLIVVGILGFGVSQLAPNFALAIDQGDVAHKLVGHPYSGTENGKTYVEELRSNGSVQGSDNDGSYSGSWKVGANNTICLNYADHPAWDCSHVTITGNVIRWVDEDGKSSFSTFTSR
jgi:hypothetical protein